VSDAEICLRSLVSSLMPEHGAGVGEEGLIFIHIRGWVMIILSRVSATANHICELWNLVGASDVAFRYRGRGLSMNTITLCSDAVAAVLLLR